MLPGSASWHGGLTGVGAINQNHFTPRYRTRRAIARTFRLAFAICQHWVFATPIRWATRSDGRRLQKNLLEHPKPIQTKPIQTKTKPANRRGW
jgi:hypothetical protein